MLMLPPQTPRTGRERVKTLSKERKGKERLQLPASNSESVWAAGLGQLLCIKSSRLPTLQYKRDGSALSWGSLSLLGLASKP